VNDKIEHGQQAVEHLLKNLGKPVVLGKTPYANLRYIVDIIAASPFKDTPEMRGLYLSEFVEGIIATGVGDGEPRTQSQLCWAVLKMRYIDHEQIGQIAAKLSISPRAVERYRYDGVVSLERKLLGYFPEPDIRR